MLVQEDYRNLNILDRSLIKCIDPKDESISIDSEIYVDKVRDPHSFTHVMDILDQADVGGIVFRASRRQLCLVLANYKVCFTDFVYNNIDEINNRYSHNTYCRDANEVKAIISKLFQVIYGDMEGVKKVWDILVIKADNKRDLRNKRLYARNGFVPTPNDKEYGLYIKALGGILNNKLIKYKESKMPNLKTKDDFMKFFISEERLQKIKVKDTIYVLDSRDSSNTGSSLLLIYSKQNSEGESPYNYIHVKISFEGIYPVITGIYGSERRYSNELTDILNDNN